MTAQAFPDQPLRLIGRDQLSRSAEVDEFDLASGDGAADGAVGNAGRRREVDQSIALDELQPGLPSPRQNGAWGSIRVGCAPGCHARSNVGLDGIAVSRAIMRLRASVASAERQNFDGCGHIPAPCRPGFVATIPGRCAMTGARWSSAPLHPQGGAPSRRPPPAWGSRGRVHSVRRVAQPLSFPAERVRPRSADCRSRPVARNPHAGRR